MQPKTQHVHGSYRFVRLLNPSSVDPPRLDFPRTNGDFFIATFKWFLLFLLVHRNFHHFLCVFAGQQELSTPLEDVQLARAVGDTQNTPATDKEDIHVVVGAGWNNTLVEFRVLHAMDYCGGKLICTLGNYTVQLIAATGKKTIDETTAAGDLDGIFVQREAQEADKSKPGYTPVHHMEGNVEVPW